MEHDLPVHRNWLAEHDFLLPNERFSRYLDTPSVNLLDVLQTAAQRLTNDGIVVIRPIGSCAYARIDGQLQWDLVRDLDIWIYVSPSTLEQGEWRQLHADMQQRVWEVLRERRVLSHRSRRTGYVYLREFDGRLRMVELKLADLSWLKAGLLRAHHRSPRLLRGPTAAHFEEPRLEWAGYTPYENYFPARAAEGAWQQNLDDITSAQALYGLHHTYAENLAEAYRVLTPVRLARATTNARLFFRYSRKVVKKLLMLAVMRGDEVERQARVAQLLDLQSGRDYAFSAQTRRSYLSGLVADLEELRCGGLPRAIAAWLEPETTGMQSKPPRPRQADHDALDLR
jgi:hypothetical protein